MPKTLFIVVSLFLSLIIGMFLIWPKYQELVLIQAEIEQQSSELRNKENYMKDLRTVSLNLEEYKESFSKIDSALPSEVSIPSLFNFFQKKASDNGLLAKEMKLSGTKEFSFSEESSGEYSPEGISFQPSLVQSAEKTGIKKTLIDLSLSGSYPGLKSFLSSIEKNARFIEVKNIAFTAPKEKETSFSFNLTIEVYSY